MKSSYLHYKIGDVVSVNRHGSIDTFVVCGFTPRSISQGSFWIDVAFQSNPTHEINGYGEEIVTFVSRPMKINDDLFDEDLFEI